MRNFWIGLTIVLGGIVAAISAANATENPDAAVLLKRSDAARGGGLQD